MPVAPRTGHVDPERRGAHFERLGDRLRDVVGCVTTPVVVDEVEMTEPVAKDVGVLVEDRYTTEYGRRGGQRLTFRTLERAGAQPPASEFEGDERRLERIWEVGILPFLEDQLFGKEEELERFGLGAIKRQADGAEPQATLDALTDADDQPDRIRAEG